MKGHVNTKNGEISIENQVIAKYAGICALGCFGIVGMAMVNMKRDCQADNQEIIQKKVYLFL